MNVDTATFLARAAGHWSGTETITIDPTHGATIETTARLENQTALDGRAMLSPYEQSTEGVVGLRCHTAHHFADDGAVAVWWMPSTGTPAAFTGRRDDFVLRVRRTDEHGIEHVLTSDYTEPGVLRTSMEMVLPDGGAMRVFEGHYTRVAAPAGRALWHDLTVDDADERRNFYASVLGWTAEPCDMGGYCDYHMLDASGEIVAGICHARGANAGLPPRWLVYFSVRSVDAAIEAARVGGGSLVGEVRGYENFRYAILLDPDGAPFVACEQNPSKD